MTDQQFAEIMSCRMGREQINTPAMDSLAADGMLFTRAYSPKKLDCFTRQIVFARPGTFVIFDRVVSYKYTGYNLSYTVRLDTQTGAKACRVAHEIGIGNCY